MKKLLNNPWVVGALALIAVVFVAHSLMPANEGSGAHPIEEAVVNESVADAPSATLANDVSGARDALAALPAPTTTRDPFASRKKITPVITPVAEQVVLPDIVETIHLTALWTQSGETWVLINGRTYRAGDLIGRLTLESATQDGVWLTHWKGRDFVEVGSRFTLVTPAVPIAQFQPTSPQGS